MAGARGWRSHTGRISGPGSGGWRTAQRVRALVPETDRQLSEVRSPEQSSAAAAAPTGPTDAADPDEVREEAGVRAVRRRRPGTRGMETARVAIVCALKRERAPLKTNSRVTGSEAPVVSEPEV